MKTSLALLLPVSLLLLVHTNLGLAKETVDVTSLNTDSSTGSDATSSSRSKRQIPMFRLGKRAGDSATETDILQPESDTAPDDLSQQEGEFLDYLPFNGLSDQGEYLAEMPEAEDGGFEDENEFYPIDDEEIEGNLGQGSRFRLRRSSEESDEEEGGLQDEGFEGEDSNPEKRALSMLRLGKRPMSMLRLGKRPMSMLRLGKRPMSMLRLGKRPMSMLRLGKRPMSMLRLGKRPMSMLRLGKRPMSMLRLGKRPMSMLRLGKRPMSMLRLGKRPMSMLRLGKRPMSMLRLGKRPMSMLRLRRKMHMLRLGKRPMSMLRLGKRSLGDDESSLLDEQEE